MTLTFGLQPTLIFDGDNTLWRCSEYYNQAREEAAHRIEQTFGVSFELARDLVNYIDLFAVKAAKNGGFQRERMGQALAGAGLAAAAALTGQVRPDIAQDLFAVGDSVFNAPYDLYPGVHDMLQRYRAAGWRILIYTKGDVAVQQAKLLRHSMRDYVNGVVITPVKSMDTIRELCASNLVDIPHSYMIGDSMKDDIIPAHSAGLQTVHVADPDNHWGYEDEADTVRPLVTIPIVTDLPVFIPLEAHA